MALAGSSLVTIDDFTGGEIEAIFAAADEMQELMKKPSELCHGKVMASLFFEPSTRTRLSFETAMHRLGGSVVSAVDTKATSLAKGESLSDMARVVGSYADIIVIRHPWEGAARVMADYAGVPVINAGDGGHQHPTQTLLDLYTIKRERKVIKGLKIALWGDLKYGRTIHSLIFALAKMGANILFCPSPGLEVPDHVMQKLIAEYGGELERPNGTTVGASVLPLDAVYVTPGSPHQLAMMPVSLQVEMEKGIDALYVTRTQKERFTQGEGAAPERHAVVDKKLLAEKELKKTLIMHPLPRVDELARELDSDPRSMYFKQAAWGVPVRMALIALLLGLKKTPPLAEEAATRPEYPIYQRESGIRCPNPRCVSVQETEIKYLKPTFKIIGFEPLTLRCLYCEHGFEPKYVASTEWHEGKAETKRYHSAHSHLVKKIRPENLILFESEQAAEAAGFRPGHFAEDKANE